MKSRYEVWMRKTIGCSTMPTSAYVVTKVLNKILQTFVYCSEVTAYIIINFSEFYNFIANRYYFFDKINLS